MKNLSSLFPIPYFIGENTGNIKIVSGVMLHTRMRTKETIERG